MTEELADLGTPSSEGAKADAMVAQFEKAVAKVEANPGSALTQSEKIFAATKKLAGEYGLVVCHQP